MSDDTYMQAALRDYGIAAARAELVLAGQLERPIGEALRERYTAAERVVRIAQAERQANAAFAPTDEIHNPDGTRPMRPDPLLPPA